MDGDGQINHHEFRRVTALCLSVRRERRLQMMLLKWLCSSTHFIRTCWVLFEMSSLRPSVRGATGLSGRHGSECGIYS